MAKIIRKARSIAKPAKPLKKVAKKAVAKAKLKKTPKKTSKPKPSKPKPSKPRPWTAAEVYEAFSRFRKANPEPKGELEHLNPYTLLVAVVLSAQATDAGVNKATRALFAVADTPQKMLDLGEEKVRDYIKTIGLYRNKAKNVIALSEKLIAEFGSQVPRTRAEIESLPGAGRKTANVVLNMAFGEHTMAVDTHVFRVGNRTGIAPGNDAFGSRARAGEGDSVRVHAARTSLADPARPLHLPGARPALRGVFDQRPLPLAGEDGVGDCAVLILRRRISAVSKDGRRRDRGLHGSRRRFAAPHHEG